MHNARGMPTGRRFGVQPSGLQSVVARVSIDFPATTWQGFSSGSATGQSACRIRTLHYTPYCKLQQQKKRKSARDGMTREQQQPPPSPPPPLLPDRNLLSRGYKSSWSCGAFCFYFSVCLYLLKEDGGGGSGGLRDFVLEQADRGLGSCLFPRRHDFT